MRKCHTGLFALIANSHLRAGLSVSAADKTAKASKSLHRSSAAPGFPTHTSSKLTVNAATVWTFVM